MSISNRDLYARSNRMRRERIQAEKRVLSRCVTAIREACNRGETKCNYRIPDHILLVMPHTVDKDLCASYLVEKLPGVNRNLKPVYLGEGILQIDWSR